MTNSVGGTKEIYFSNGGTLDLGKNQITPDGGLNEEAAKEMDLPANLLPKISLKGEKVETAANTGADSLTLAHMRNWMECLRSRKQPNAPIGAGYNHAVAVIMANAAYRIGEKVTFDDARQEVVAGGKVFTL
jgi:hypothetical protein